MIKVTNVSFSYNNSSSPLIDDLNCKISKGEHIALTGPNGSGKSTLGYLIAGIYTPDSGSIQINGLSTQDPDQKREIRKEIGYIFQDPGNQMVTTSVKRELVFGPENLSMPSQKIREQLEWAVNYFDLQSKLNSSPGELSGGEKEKVALASILTMNPQIIILDEPTAYLDFKGSNILWDLVEKLKRDTDLTIINVTQSLDELKAADRVFFLNKGNLGVFYPDQKKNFTTSFDNYLQSAQLERLDFQKQESSYNAIIDVNSVDFSYDGSQVLNDISLKINESEQIGIVGRAGSGKSTLAHLITQLIEPDKGSIQTDGRIGLVFQFPEKQFFEETVLKDVAFGPKNIGLENPREKAKKNLQMVAIRPHFFEKNPLLLSGGEKRRVAIASILSLEPDILIFDEPTCGLDPYGIKTLVNIYKKLIEQGKSIITISHNLNFLNSVTGRIIGLKNGKIVYDGDKNSCFSDAELLKKLQVSDRPVL